MTTPPPPPFQYPQLTRDQYRKLTKHAAALNATPEEALQVLLDLPPLTGNPARRPWTADELAMLANPANSPRTIAAKIGRTRASVSNKRHKMLRKANEDGPA